jgi:hypothetical protein
VGQHAAQPEGHQSHHGLLVESAAFVYGLSLSAMPECIQQQTGAQGTGQSDNADIDTKESGP